MGEKVGIFAGKEYFRVKMLKMDLDAQDQALLALIKPLKKNLDIEALMVKQNYQHPAPGELDEIMREAAIEESIEDLLHGI